MANVNNSHHRRKNTSDGTLSKRQLIKAIRKHEEVEAVGGLTNEQVAAVLRAFADTIWVACLNNIRVKFEYMGFFEPFKRQGYKGGYIKTTALQRMHGMASEVFSEGKPDYKIIKFRFGHAASKRFRELTQEDVSE